MTDIGTFVNDLFKPLGLWGGLICIFVLFYIDAIIFPTFPELFTVLIFTTDYGVNTLAFGAAILVVIVVAEILGVLTLFIIVKKARVPDRVGRVVKKYQSFLLYPDERMILVNRLAPIIPFLGAFIALTGWDLKRSMNYVVLGGVIKYGIILSLSWVFIEYMNRGTATTITIIMVVIIIALSMVATLYRKRRMENAHRPA